MSSQETSSICILYSRSEDILHLINFRFCTYYPNLSLKYLINQQESEIDTAN